MKKQLLAGILFPVCALAHNSLFWGEKMGLNTLLFAFLMTSALFFLHPESTKSRPAIISAVGVLLTACMVVWHNSLLGKVAHCLFFTALIGFVQARELRFIFYAFCLGVVSMVEMRVKVLQEVFAGMRGKNSRSWQLASNVRMMGVVAPVVFLFFGMYYFSNEKFAQFTGQFFAKTWAFFVENFSPQWMLSMLGSILVAGGILWKTSPAFFEKIQARQAFALLRRKLPLLQPVFDRGMMDLKKEHRTAFLLLAVLNKLLLTVNVFDIRYVWFGDAPDNPYSLKMYVHEGTWLLIAAILLAIAVLLFVFRKNLNFFPENKWLKILAYCWIAQNAVLACSVGVRNWRYIEACGLAYKRIGVCLFLALVLFGLGTVAWKIMRARTLYFLWHHNAWAMFGILALASCVNWDVFITRHNLAAETKYPLDAVFLIREVSDKNLFLLEENMPVLTKKAPESIYGLPVDYEKWVREKRQDFEAEQAKYSWLSWNWADERNLN